ncbi:MAG: hypothetical protein EOM85_04045 [Candidatus Moranbacteria bacterium]|nr:hypothetical protein [Candidatus Moranbacteria bacterium]
MNNEHANELGRKIISESRTDVNAGLRLFKLKDEKLKKAVKNKSGSLKDIYDNIPKEDRIVLLKSLERDSAKNDYKAYLKYVYPHFIMTKFHEFLANICQDIVNRIERGEIVKVIISTPPQHGKSETITKTLPSYFVGRNPDRNAILVAHSFDLAEKFGDSNRKLTRKFGNELFNIEISQSQDNKTNYELKEKRGGVMSVGIDAGITGNGGSLIIVDDPYKNGFEVSSSTIRSRKEGIMRDSVISRMRGKGQAIIIIMTRWHEEDIAGILSQEDGWIVINIPCICESDKDVLGRKIGQTLCPELGFDAEWAIGKKKDVGEKTWNALYQGRPSIEKGNIFKRDDFRFYSESELPDSFEEKTMSCDLSFKDNIKSDKVAIGVWGKLGSKHYLLKKINKRLSFTKTIEMMKILLSEYKDIKKILVEEKANGSAVIDTLKDEIAGIIPIIPKQDKISRANSATVYFEAGNVYFPKKELDNEIDGCVEQMLKFPNSSYDDFVDMTTQYLNEIRHKDYGRISTNSNVINLAKAMKGMRI